MTRPTVLSVAALCAAALTQHACAQNPAPSPAGGATTTSVASFRGTPPKLLVFITVDQLRPDYFSRFDSQLTGGLGRLYRGGAVFTNAFQDHGITETAPGHSTTMSGRHPRSTGILENTRGVYDPRAPLIDASGDPASPERFRGTVLFDWLRAKDHRSRALSVSRKDRGAILPLGRAKEQVYWYATNGTFTTSRYYADTLPDWVRRFNARREPMRYAGQVWSLLLDEAEYPEPDSVIAEAGPRYQPQPGVRPPITFPYYAPEDSARAAAVLPAFPWMDQLTLAFALEGLQTLRLGAGPQTDVLAISLSTTDAVGHRFGPDSREIHDHILRLDRYLGAFFDSLYKVRDSASVIVALTADHGVAPNPAVTSSRDPSRRAEYATAVFDTVAAFRRRVIAARVDSTAFEFDSPFLLLDREKFRRARVPADSVVRAFVRAVRSIPVVQRADIMRELARRDTTKDVIARRWLHAFPPDLPVEVAITLQPYSYWYRSNIATHGTPHDYDAHVPVIFYGPPFVPGKYDQFARVVDMAPTLAAVMGVTPSERLDGRVLEAAVH